MPLLTLRQSLSRTKNKWKKRFNFESKDQTSSAVSQGPSRTSSLSPGITSLLSALGSSADVFGPFKSAIDGLSSCFATYEDKLHARRDYQELRRKIDTTLKDMTRYMNGPVRRGMTGSVKLICLDLAAEVKNLEELHTQSTGRRLLDAMAGLDEVMGGYGRVQGHLERLMLNLNLAMLESINEEKIEKQLDRLLPSMSAVYNSSASDKLERGSCTQGTRESQIRLLIDWARTPDAGKTCWMNGMAGTGKTTIAYTVCDRLANACALGASFFCSRVLPECRQVEHIIPSIAYQLARFSNPFMSELCKVLHTDPDARTRALNVQYKKLIVEPLVQAQKSLPTDFIVVIDALDECENEKGIGQILDVLLYSAHTLPIRFLVSSRPEREITLRLGGQLDQIGDACLVLHDLASEDVRTDIEAYLRGELEDVPLNDTQWSSLIDSCGVLFIYASTTCRYIKQAYAMDTLDDAMGMIANLSSRSDGLGGTNEIDQLYLTILIAAFKKSRMNPMSEARMRDLLETVICAVEPMTLTALADLINLNSIKQVTTLLEPLRSVLNVTKANGLVTTIHASFPDFLLSQQRSHSFYCDSGLSTMLIRISTYVVYHHRNILDSKVENLDERVSQAISPGLTYASRHWSTHLQLGEYQESLTDLVRSFFQKRLLLWMEIINLTQYMRYGPGIIRDAEQWCHDHTAPDDVASLAHDAWQFVSVYANHVLCQSTPHIYVSMLPFWPQSRPVSIAYMPRSSGLVRPTGTAISQRHLALLATWKVASSLINSMSLSADGSRLVADCKDSVEMVHTSTGNSVLSLTGLTRGYIEAVAISPDGTRIAYGGAESTLYLWDIDNRATILEPLAEHGSGVTSVVFSPDGMRIACGMGKNVYIQFALKPLTENKNLTYCVCNLGVAVQKNT